MERYVLFLAGGRWQLPWFKFLKRKKHKIILVDPNEEPPCKKFCDIFIKCDVKSINNIISFIEKNSLEIELVTSDQTDVTTIPVAKLSQYFGTRHIPLSVVQQFSNKFISRSYVDQNFGGIHQPAFTKVYSLKDIADFASEVQRKIVVKPPDAQSSRGIFVVHQGVKEHTIRKKFQKAQKFSGSDFLLAEEFVEGTEITIEGVLSGNRHNILAASQKKHFRTGIASDLIYPLNIKEKLWNEIVQFHNAVIEKTGLKFGLTHSEYIVSEDTNNFYLVEMACRGGGTLIPSDIVPWLSGVNLYDIFYRQLVEDNYSDDESSIRSNTKKRAAMLHFFEFPSGTVLDVSGVSEAQDLPGVLALDLEFKAGDTLRPASDDRGRQGFIIILEESLVKVSETKNEVYERININYQV